jgi:hypothetical protein
MAESPSERNSSSSNQDSPLATSQQQKKLKEAQEKLEEARVIYEALNRLPETPLCKNLKRSAQAEIKLRQKAVEYEQEKQIKETLESSLYVRIVQTEATIALFKTSSASELLRHEAKDWLNRMLLHASIEDAPQELRDDISVAWKYVGAENGAPLSERQRDKFASRFERFLLENTAPTKELGLIFAHFKKWLVAEYKVIDELHYPISEDIRDWHNRILSIDHGAMIIAPDRNNNKAIRDSKMATSDAEQFLASKRYVVVSGWYLGLAYFNWFATYPPHLAPWKHAILVLIGGPLSFIFIAGGLATITGMLHAALKKNSSFEQTQLMSYKVSVLIAPVICFLASGLAVNYWGTPRLPDLPDQSDRLVTSVQLQADTTMTHVGKTSAYSGITINKSIKGVTSVSVGDDVDGVHVGAIKCTFFNNDASYNGEQYMWRGQWGCQAGRNISEIENAVKENGDKAYDYIYIAPIPLTHNQE